MSNYIDPTLLQMLYEERTQKRREPLDLVRFGKARRPPQEGAETNRSTTGLAGALRSAARVVASLLM